MYGFDAASGRRGPRYRLTMIHNYVVDEYDDNGEYAPKFEQESEDHYFAGYVDALDFLKMYLDSIEAFGTIGTIKLESEEADDYNHAKREAERNQQESEA